MSLRYPAVAGSFYSADSSELERDVEGYLLRTRAEKLPKALVVPHAGYRYSGSLAGRAYGLIADMADQIERIVILGPNHTAPLKGAVAPSNSIWRTPVGDMSIDQTEIKRLVGLGLLSVDDLPHHREHCLEVQLPFLQVIFTRDVGLVPVIVGEMSTAEAGELVRACWGGPETLLIISSDLSHYLPYKSAQKLDSATAAAVLAANPDLLGYESACGRYPLRGLLQVAAESQMEVQQLGLWNSGDTAGDRDRVVGYGSFAFYERAS